ncbi:SEL1-like repeat protein [Saccharibacillus sacchari]|uniref:Tetratricopeptide repeat protein n=1 Tax=Saccharibacillus sacchari TaxID=456493 RepID=A0ACC6PFI2_9BACL
MREASHLRTFEKQEKFIRIGWARIEKGQFKRALRAFNRANRPPNAEALLFIGYVQELLNEAEAAEKAYRRAAENGDPEGWTALAAVLVRTERRDQAFEILEKATAQQVPSAFLLRAGLYSEDAKTNEARIDYLRAAELGLTEGWNGLALHEFNQGHIEEALSCCREADRLGNLNAAHNMGLLLLNQDRTEEAKTWLIKSAESGMANAMYLLGELARDDGMWNEARSWHSQAAERGHFDARYGLEGTYTDKFDRKIRRVLEQRWTWDKQSAEQLGILYMNNNQLEKALAIWNAFADYGDPIGHYNLGVIYQRKNQIEKALEHYRLAAAEGNTEAAYNLGVHYQQIAQNPQLAKHWYERAASAGHLYAAYNLGNIYSEEKRLDYAKEMYEKAADRGFVKAQNNLAGVFLEEAEMRYEERLKQQEKGVPSIPLFGANGLARRLEAVPQPERDLIEQAENLYRKAADKDLDIASMNLASLLHDLDKLEESEHWYKIAVKQNDPEAQFGYAELLVELGREAEALRLYQASADQGWQQSVEHVQKYAQKKT